MEIYQSTWNVKSFFNETLDFLLRNSGPPKFRVLPKLHELCNVVAEIQLKLLNERALSTGEPCTCEYVTLLQTFQRYI